jgi:UDP-galactopyranose mutase
MASGIPIVVFSHLRWNFVYQRPQHLLSRLAAEQPVLFVEEPEYDASGPPRWERATPEPGVTVFRPRTPVAEPGFHAAQLGALGPMLEEIRDEAGPDGLVAWLYTPLALPLARQLDPVLVVYDCMDELSMFLGAPPELVQREAELMEVADVMFTGGPSLYAAKRDKHPNVHCFPSSVDAAHFGRAQPGGSAEQPADQRDLPYPRLGYYGVIDERLDLPLIAALADAHPEWQLVLVGPVVKIDPAALPRRPNIHYTGQRTYGELPGYLAGWDVCLLPFARNDSTRFISPTKTLEYMAAERPIVSTPIADVAGPYGHIVHLGDTPEEFIRACEAALAADTEERARRAALMRGVLARTSWVATVASMKSLMAEKLARRSPAVSARAGKDLVAHATEDF